MTSTPADQLVLPRRPLATTWRWVLSFIGFPLGGLTAMLLVGPVDAPGAAVAGGLVTGLVLGAVQGWALRLAPGRLLAWAAATGAGLAVGLTVATAAVSFGTTATALAVQGAVSGAAVGLAQVLALRGQAPRSAALWPPYVAAVWALGWTLTTAVGVDVDRHWTVFGAAGAVTAAVLTAVLPLTLARRSH